ncbi:hypothetical protein HID58_070616 [Brassica napus]|uniref:TIR domain-containing protein n=1 Tax=Brassica napus TaxID=3708 RepID=A0ABQ7YZ98_BRANA|nr:hypothetical protein HID58_070616 [Brassica napus]
MASSSSSLPRNWDHDVFPSFHGQDDLTKIAIVLLSERYASSSWCLEELVEIMNRELGQMVMTIFYKVNPTDVKKQTGDFGKVFEETCQGENKEKIETWRQALEGVATIAGYHIYNKHLDRDIDRKQRGQHQFLNHEEELIDDDAAGHSPRASAGPDTL